MAPRIKISPTSKEVYKVQVSGKTETMHSVSMTDQDYERFTGRRKPKEQLVLFAFKFLLRREENTSILREFAIRKINEYFPEFEKEVVDWSKL
ncbi:hypothetical protein N9U60_03815 [Betaproteobacteria bacterium]|nr:hypothetical protein [Betaproteobacteria bacterium]